MIAACPAMSVAVFTFPEYCWRDTGGRCRNRVSPDDELGLCEHHKAELLSQDDSDVSA